MPAFGWPWRRVAVPSALRDALAPDEQVQVVASMVGGNILAASRFGLWMVTGDGVVRWQWDRVSKARLSARTLTVIAADEVGTTPDGLVLLADLPPLQFELTGTTGLTDAVHHRVRRSVAASRHLEWPGAGGWVVLRRVPGRDGLTRQVRLDAGADAGDADFLAAAARTAAQLELELTGS